MSYPITDKFELQWRLIYSVIIAGKNANFAQAKTHALLCLRRRDELPFQYLARLRSRNRLGQHIADCRIGNYTKFGQAILDLLDSNIDLTTCTPGDLEKIHGIGPKTSRFFIMWTRPDARHAALDVHILRWMRENGYPHAPKATPGTAKLYAELEAAFIAEAEKRGKTPRELDLEIWAAGNVGGIQ